LFNVADSPTGISQNPLKIPSTRQNRFRMGVVFGMIPQWIPLTNTQRLLLRNPQSNLMHACACLQRNPQKQCCGIQCLRWQDMLIESIVSVPDSTGNHFLHVLKFVNRFRYVLAQKCAITQVRPCNEKTNWTHVSINTNGI